MLFVLGSIVFIAVAIVFAVVLRLENEVAAALAGIYWASVVVTFVWAMIDHDEFGFAFIPFVYCLLGEICG